VIVDDFDIRRPGISLRPIEADPPLQVDADRILAGALRLQSFKAMAGQRAEIGEAGRRPEDFEAFPSSALEASELGMASPAAKASVRLSLKLRIMSKLAHDDD